MTREEVIALLNEQYETCKRIYDCSADQRKSYPNVPQFMEALSMSLSALRPVSREQVEKVWGFGGWETVPDQGFVDTMGRQVYHLHCHHCGFFWREKGHAKYFKFCPACGAPMTDEAVQMVMERLEALHEV